MLLALLATLASAGDCDGDRVPPSAVKAEVDAALMAFSALDEDGFFMSYEATQGLLACVDSAVDARDAAALHRLEGIKRFLDGNDAGAQRAFETSLALEPGYTLPSSLAPAGGPLARLYTDAANASGTGVATLSTDKGTLIVDGAPTGKVSDERPAVVQVARSRSIVWSGYWGPEGLPSWFDVAWNEGDAPAGDAVVDLEGDSRSRSTTTSRTREGSRTPTTRTTDSRSTTSDRDRSTSRDRSTASRDRSTTSRERDDRSRESMRLDPPKKASAGGPRPAVGIAAVATGIAAAALYGTAVGGRLSYNNDPTDGKRALTNGTYFGSVGLGLVAGGLGIAWIAMPVE